MSVRNLIPFKYMDAFDHVEKVASIDPEHVYSVTEESMYVGVHIGKVSIFVAIGTSARETHKEVLGKLGKEL